MVKAKQNCNNSFVLTFDDSINSSNIVVSGCWSPLDEEEQYRTYDSELRKEKHKITVDNLKDKVLEVRRRMIRRKESIDRKKLKSKKNSDTMTKRLSSIKSRLEVLKDKLRPGNKGKI